ncbi:hypothetical protein F8B77_01485 [Aliivibrio finisterrensis]|uniref:Outer membrane protein beta-barrel domain-containing protein n=1 Tax=Aliivibrio finisterrensis TaxID=511998 RepID=A0A6N6RXR1_9GAMM|nr:hypothetical protein F8B77_01485 [Aliivibrio finisterrensis]
MIRKTLLASSLMFISTTSMAADNDPNNAIMSNFSYDYVEARIGFSPSTFGAGLSTSIHPNAHAIISIDSELDGDYDLATGFGFHAPVNNWADMTGEMLLRVIDDNKHYNNDTGMELNLGVRQWLGPQLEVGGKVGYLSIKGDDDTLFSVYGRFHSTELFSIGAEGRFNGIYGDQVMLTARFKY